MGLSLQISGASVQAFKEPLVGGPPLGFRGGPVLGDDEKQRRLRHTRSRIPVDSFTDGVEPTTQLPGQFAYGGAIYDHFGHTMAEFVHRVVQARSVNPNAKWLFLSTKSGPQSLEALPHWAVDIYRFLEVDLSSVVLSHDAVVDDLLIAESGSDLGAGPYPEYLGSLSDFTAPRLDRRFAGEQRYEKVYVSRSRLTRVGQVLGERYVEANLEAEGFSLFYPEMHPPTVQMDVYRKARVAIFPEGSACHGTELLGSDAMGTCVLIPRRIDHVVLFERVLRPRSKEFHSFPLNTYLGTALRSPTDGMPIEYRGATLYDFDRLISRYRRLGIARLPTVSRSAYLDCAREDLVRYLAEMADGPGFDEGLASQVQSAFEAAARS